MPIQESPNSGRDDDRARIPAAQPLGGQFSFQNPARRDRLQCRLGQVLLQNLSLQEALQNWCQQLAESSQLSLSQIWIDDRTGGLELKAAMPASQIDLGLTLSPADAAVVQQVALECREAIQNNAPCDSLTAQFPSRPHELRSLTAFPLIADADLVGVVCLWGQQVLPLNVVAEIRPSADGFAQFLARRLSASNAGSANLVATPIPPGRSPARESERTVRETYASNLRRVIDNMLGMVGVLDPQGRLLDANKTALAAGNLKREEVLGKKFWDCYWWNFDEESRSRLQAAVRRAAGGQIVRYDTWVRSGNDARMMIDFMLVPVRDEAGGVTHLIPSGVDITERKLAEEEVRQRERHLNVALEAGGMGSWEWDVVRDHITWSERLYDLFGYKPEEFVPTASGFLEIVVPEDRPLVEAVIDSVMSSDSMREEFECRTIRGDDGRVIVAQCHGIVDRDASGRPLRLTGFAADITERRRQETELKDREAHLRRVINNQLGLVGVIDEHGCLVEIDDDSLRIAGVAREGVIGRHFAECPWWAYDDSVPERIRESMEKAFAGETVRFDIPLFAEGDQRLLIDFMLAPVRDAEGRIGYLIWSGIDNSERAKVEQAQKDNERRLEMALRAGGMAAWEWRPEESIWTDALYKMLGIPTNELASSERFFDCVLEEDRPGLVEAWGKVTRGEQPYNHEFRIVRPDGEQRWLVGTGEFERDETGAVNRIYGLNWDITDRKTAELRARRAAQAEHFLLEASSVLTSSLEHEQTLARVTDLCVPTIADWAFIDLIDEAGVPRRVHVAHADPAHRDLAKEVAKFPARPDRLDHPPARSLFGEEAVLITHFSDQMLEKAAQNEAHAKVMRAVGPTCFIVVPLSSRNTLFGALTLMMSDSGRSYDKYDLRVAKDLAQQAAVAVDNARLFRAAQQANVAKSEFLANMSHEIRTPMTAVLGYAELLREYVEDGEPRNYLQTIHRNGEFLLGIINDILDLSKIEAGKLEIVREPVELVRLIEDIRSVMEVRAAENDLQLKVDYRSEVPAQFESDPRRLKQILINLIGNAIKFTRAGSVTVEVRFEPERHELVIAIVDSGIGMSSEQLLKLFKPFSQGDATVSREFGGTGLGLAISRRLAHLLGGDIAVESREGCGSTFTLIVQVGEVRDAASPSPEVASEADSTSSLSDLSDETPHEVRWLDRRILVVDDRRDIRFLSSRLLASRGAAVIEAEDGILAVATVRRGMEQGEPPELILLDMQMPNLDGYQTARELRALGYRGPIIALTADAMQGDIDRCLKAGCDAHLSKPIDSQQLVKLVESHIG